MDKLEYGEKVIEAQKRIAVPRRATAYYGQVATGGSAGEYTVLIAG